MSFEEEGSAKYSGVMSFQDLKTIIDLWNSLLF